MTPASIRNHNPGAMEPGPSAKKFGSTSYETLRWTGPDGKPKTNRIATFPTPQHGAAAMFDLLERKYTGRPLRDAIATWCGSYWAGEYARSVEAACGITGGDLLTQALVRNPDRAIPLAKAMARVEAGRDYPMDDDGWRRGHRMAFGEALAPAPSPDNDVPFQKPEARTREVLTAAAKWAGGISIPAVPAAVTTNVTNAQGWQALGDQAAALIKWGITSPLALGILAATCALFWLQRKARGALWTGD